MAPPPPRSPPTHSTWPYDPLWLSRARPQPVDQCVGAECERQRIAPFDVDAERVRRQFAAVVNRRSGDQAAMGRKQLQRRRRTHRHSGDIAALRVDATGDIQRKHRFADGIDGRDQIGGGSFRWSRQADTEDGVDDQIGMFEGAGGIRTAPPERLELRACTHRQCACRASHAHDLDIATRLQRMERKHVSIAAVVARAACYGDALGPWPTLQ